MHDRPVGISQAGQQKQGNQTKDKSMPDSWFNPFHKVILFASNAVDFHKGYLLKVRRRPILTNLDQRLLLQIQRLILPER